MEKEIEAKAIEYLTAKPVQRHHHEANYIVYQRPYSNNWFKISTKEVNDTIDNHKNSLKMQSRLPKSFAKMANGGGVGKLTEQDFKNKKIIESNGIKIELEKRTNPNYYIANYIDTNENEKISSYGSPYIEDVIYDIKTTKYAKGGGVGEQNISFEYKGKKHIFSFTPTEPDEWTSFESHGLIFDVHYDEDYNHIVVYEVIDGKAQTQKNIYVKKLFAKGGEVGEKIFVVKDNKGKELKRTKSLNNASDFWSMNKSKNYSIYVIEGENKERKLLGDGGTVDGSLTNTWNYSIGGL